MRLFLIETRKTKDDMDQFLIELARAEIARPFSLIQPSQSNINQL